MSHAAAFKSLVVLPFWYFSGSSFVSYCGNVVSFPSPLTSGPTWDIAACEMIAAKVKLLMVLPFWHRSYYFAIAQRATVWQSCSLDWSLGRSEGERITPSVKLEASLLYIWEPATTLANTILLSNTTSQHFTTIYFQHPANWHWFLFSCPRVATHTTSQIADWFKIPTFIFWSSFSLVFFSFFLILSSFLYLGPPENRPLEPSSQEWPSNMISVYHLWKQMQGK